jgi:hypothetical protein
MRLAENDGGLEGKGMLLEPLTPVFVRGLQRVVASLCRFIMSLCLAIFFTPFFTSFSTAKIV